MVLWCLDKDSDLYEEITNLDKYIINFLSEEQKDIANSLAQKNDHILDETNLFPNRSGFSNKRLYWLDILYKKHNYRFWRSLNFN